MTIGNGIATVRLGDLSEITMGNSPPGDSYNERGEGTALINGPVEFGKGPFGETQSTKWTTSPTKFCRKGDLIICVRGSTTGRTNLAAFDACIGRGVAAIRSRESQGYLNHFVRTLRQAIFTSGRGSTFPSISREQLSDIPIPLPPLAEQKRIAGILDAADALRARRRESLAQLDTLLQSTFLDMFGDPVTNPKGWKVKSMGATCEILTGYAFPSSKFIKRNTGIALCRGINVGIGGTNWKDRVDWPVPYGEELKRFEVMDGDIVLAMDRPWISGGLKIAVVTPSDLPALLVQRVARIRADNVAQQRLVYELVRSESFAHHCNPTETTVPHISPRDLKSFPLIQPPIDLQQSFAGIVKSVEQQKARMRSHLDELDTLFASLQSRAFNGEL